MAVPHIVAIFPVNARMQLDDPIQVLPASSLAVASSQCEPSATEEPNDEDDVFSGSAAAVTRYASHASGANVRQQYSAAGIWNRGS
jgi:hypothetical protein